jgi:hypothetical protein
MEVEWDKQESLNNDMEVEWDIGQPKQQKLSSWML